MEWFLDKNNAVYKTFSEELDIDVVGTPNVGDTINIDSVNSFIYNVKPKTEFGTMMASGTGGDCDFEEVRYMSNVGISVDVPNGIAINPLQMTHGADWSGLTTENHLSGIWSMNDTSESIVLGDGIRAQIERDGNTLNYNSELQDLNRLYEQARQRNEG